MKRLIVCAAVAALLAPAALALPRAMHPTLGATLAGKNEVPKGSPTAHGIELFQRETHRINHTMAARASGIGAVLSQARADQFFARVGIRSGVSDLL